MTWVNKSVTTVAAGGTCVYNGKIESRYLRVSYFQQAFYILVGFISLS